MSLSLNPAPAEFGAAAESARAQLAELRETVATLTAQLHDVYAEREEAGGRGPLELAATVESLVEQLHALYAERDAAA